ncbi:unannotated protein [freshwater metagenome]|uniref:Unannotated protein n=1 Tax=freshwater metagenome TaxID=449393 RepID=A0A6J7EJM0_9ZZZZ
MQNVATRVALLDDRHHTLGLTGPGIEHPRRLHRREPGTERKPTVHIGKQERIGRRKETHLARCRHRRNHRVRHNLGRNIIETRNRGLHTTGEHRHEPGGQRSRHRHVERHRPNTRQRHTTSTRHLHMQNVATRVTLLDDSHHTLGLTGPGIEHPRRLHRREVSHGARRWWGEKEHLVRVARRETGEHASGRESVEQRPRLSRTGRRCVLQDPGDCAGHVRSGHGGAADRLRRGVRGLAQPIHVPRRQDLRSRREQIDARPMVGIARDAVNAGRGTHGDGRRHPCRAVEAAVIAVIAGRHDHGDTIGDHVVDRCIQCGRWIATQAHVHHGRHPGQVIVHDPLERGDDVGAQARAVARQHLHRNQRHILGDPVGGATDDAGHMGAVSVAVLGLGAVAKVDPRRSDDSCSKLGVGQAGTGVDDVGSDATTGRPIGIGVVEGLLALIDAVESPRRTALAPCHADGRIHLDAHDSGIRAQAAEVGGRERPGEALEPMCPHPLGRTARSPLKRHGRREGLIRGKAHDVARRSGLGATRHRGR